MTNTKPLPTLLIIPTGIGCEIGGYAGDAIPVARLLASASECLITHPNVMNGGSLYWPEPHIHYVEGYSLNLFTAGELLLKPVRQQKVGLLLDEGLEPDLKKRHLQVADGCVASLGLDIGPIITTERALKINLKKGLSGSSWGCIEEPDVLLRSAKQLKEAGATAIAVITRFPDDSDDLETKLYRQGIGVDLIAGAEAVISHFLVKHLLIPCAHAPGLKPLPINYDLDPRTCGEEIGYTFLPSVLVGLSRAPDLIYKSALHTKEKSVLQLTKILSNTNLGAAVVPQGALGGEAVLSCIEKSIPLIIVSNKGVLNVNSTNMRLDSLGSHQDNNVFYAENYIEAAGLITALRHGINIKSLRRPIDCLKELKNR
ncbi:DUF3326 domain-containing protein [Prochlorococcus marinus]|uniref:DUF3326 domain-containing protein n=1 Tax=Prochlorococcus marinus XMU1408 TaxID=2213228 RepID=A0A318R7M1_PROMR|nr:DUF3326 domain-containing protein [Prochlorococcus marinus]MBW3042622.1 hypothetical protein [Prochlorococcus marinus str. XMU1408]PYE01318.1 hypothetical protein DNJ73_07870 [Prochlorococcus marinus XMU1408]